ncbi:MAG: AAA family ATPase [Oscillospiraceae bacterium]|nr:AAA family ATPase [Oscillospiraceae bacterium]
MHEIQIFNHEEFGEIRTIEIDGQIYFVGSDIAKALGYAKPRNAIKKYVEKEDALKWGIPSNGGVQQTTIINESGLYSLVLASKLPAAKKFKHWVTSEVLPAIRKTGSYSPNPPKLEYNPYIYIESINVEKIINQGEIRMEQKNNSYNPQGVKRIHVYKDKDGKPLAEKHITKQPDGSKKCFWYAIDPQTGAKTFGLNGMELPLYHADRLHNQNINGDEETPIFFAEGEKDVETLEEIFEAVATCTPNGGTATSWKDSYNDDLKKRHLIILTDNDAVGEKYGLTIARNTVGFASSIRIISAKDIWSDCPEKGDISDIVQALGEDKARDLLSDAIEKAEYYANSNNVDISDFEELIKDSSEVFPEREIEYSVIRLSEVQPEPQEFLWNPYLPIGELTIMYAAGGTGKSFATVGIASDITTGHTLPRCDSQQTTTRPEKVLFISAEDNESVILNRMQEAGGNPDNCYVLKTPRTRKDLDTESFLLPQNKDDTARIQAFANLLGKIQPKLVIIDPWSVYIGDDKNMNKANDVRGVTSVLTVLAKEYHCAILVVAHVNKMPQTENANNAVSGSTALIDSSRSALCIRSFGANSDRRIIIQTKSNYQMKAKSVCYRIINQGENRTARFEWDGFSDLTEDDLTKSARTGKSLSDIENDNSDDEENKETAIEVIKRLSVHGQRINISYDRFREELRDECGEDFLPQKPTKFMNSLISDLRACGIGVELKRVRGILKDGSKDIETKRGFVISNMTDGHLMASAMPK